MKDQQTVKSLSDMEKVQIMEIMSALYVKPLEEPEVGLFFYDTANGVFGEYSLPASDSSCRRMVLSINHEIVWQMKHRIALVKHDKFSPFYDNKAVNSIPRGRVVVRADGRLCIVAGKWLDEHPKAMSEIRQMFCLPNDTTQSYHPNYDILY